MNMVETTYHESYERGHPWGERPDDLPLSAEVWDKAKNGAENSSFVIRALFEAVKQLEANQQKRQP